MGRGIDPTGASWAARTLATTTPTQFTTHRPNPCHKAGWLGKEPTSLSRNTDLFAAPSLQAECTAVSWGESRSVLGLAGCVWGNKDTCIIWMQGVHRPGSCRGSDGLHPTPLWVCAPEGECWQKKDSRRVLPICCVSNSKINLSFSIKMSVWKMSYGLCCTHLSSRGYRNKEPLLLGRECPECAVRLLKGSMPTESKEMLHFLSRSDRGQSSRSRLTLGIGWCFPPGRVLAQLGLLPTGMGSEGPWQVGV